MLFCIVNVQYVYAQTYFGEDEIISVESSLSIAGNHTIINTSIRGKGKLVFIGNADQKLMTKPHISLPEIDIHSTSSFTFVTSVYIRGNLKVFSPKLFIEDKVYLKKLLQAKDTTRIYGLTLITENAHKYQDASTPLHTSLTYHFTANAVFHETYTHPNINLTSQNTPFSYKTQHHSTVFLAIPTPPPEKNPLVSSL